MTDAAVREAPAARPAGSTATAPAPRVEPHRTRFRIDPDLLPYLALMALAALLRFWVLGDRAQHHDESMHALFSYDLYQGRGFRHDPILHGTFLFIQNALVYWLFGASDFTARLAPALYGIACVGLPYLLRSPRYLGRTGALCAALLLCLSPCFLYYSRFIREDIFAATLHFIAAICIVRYLDEPRPRWLYGLSAAFAFAFNDKENTYMTAAIFAAFMAILCWRGVVPVLLRGGSAPAARNNPPLDVLVVLCTLVAPLGTAMIIALEKLTKVPTNNDTLLAAVLALLFCLSALVGLRWRASVWATCALIFWGIFAVMFTTLFTNPVGFWTGIIDSLRYWLAQQDVHRGEQPHHYYAVLLSLYEFLPIALAAFGAVIALRQRQRFGLFCLWWAVTAFGFYTWAAEKMPWLSLHMALPIILLGSLALGRFLDGVDWHDLWQRRAVLLGGALVVLFALLAGMSSFGSPLSDLVLALRGGVDQPLTVMRRIWPWFLMAAMLVGIVFWAVSYVAELGRRRALQTVGLTLLLVAGIFYVRAAFMASYQFGDIPREMLIYTQSSPDVTAIMREIQRLNHRTGQGTNFKVAYDAGVSWPFEWYLRNQRGRVFFGEGLPPTDAGVVLVSFEPYSGGLTRADAAAQALGPDYVGTRYRLRWWFPEKYRSLTQGGPLAVPGNLIEILRSEQNRNELWRFLIYREIEPLDSTDFMLFLRRDLLADLATPVNDQVAAAAPAAPAAPATGQVAAPAIEPPTKIVAVHLLGGPGAGDGQLNDAKGIAIAPDGSIWVADTGNSRIQKFGPDGSFQLRVGSKGEGPGQFNEPWGIAVGPDGNVYVADTWNHRIQKFAPDGTFLKQWGSVVDTKGLTVGGENGFYGPRAIAFTREGSLLITDAGNKRVVIYSPEGQFLGQFGGRGVDLGRFEEPIGIATDSQGNIYVADTWNRRVQKFNAQLQPLAAFPVGGWRSQAVANKPYLAVDAAGTIYLTDPETARVQALGPDGQVLRTWGGIGKDAASLALPTGIAVDPSGRVWVADSGNGRIVAFPPVGGSGG